MYDLRHSYKEPIIWLSTELSTLSTALEAPCGALPCHISLPEFVFLTHSLFSLSEDSWPGFYQHGRSVRKTFQK